MMSLLQWRRKKLRDISKMQLQAPKNISINHLADSFKTYSIPIIGYINKESFYIDLKAVLPSQVSHLINAIKTL